MGWVIVFLTSNMLGFGIALAVNKAVNVASVGEGLFLSGLCLVVSSTVFGLIEGEK